MSVPILLALSDISIIAISAISAAFCVSPDKLCNNEAEKLVACFIYSFADNPEVMYALFAFAITVSEASLNNVSTPPICCSNSPRALTLAVTTATRPVVIAVNETAIPLHAVRATSPAFFNPSPILLAKEGDSFISLLRPSISFSVLFMSVCALLIWTRIFDIAFSLSSWAFVLSSTSFPKLSTIFSCFWYSLEVVPTELFNASNFDFSFS